MKPRIIRRTRALAALLLLPALSLSAVALADSFAVDNDVVRSGNQNVVNLTAAPGATVTTSGQIVVEYDGSRHVAPGTTVPFGVVPGQTTLPAGYAVDATSVTIPATWAEGSRVAAPPASVRFTAPATPGAYSYVVKWQPTGSGCWSSSPSCLSGASALQVNLTVEQPAVVNSAPGAPGAPATSASPSRTGSFTLSWSAASDPDGDAVTYALEHRDADDAGWSQVASGIAGTSYDAGEDEGTWNYRVRAVDEHGAAGPLSPASDPVVVDGSAPAAPSLAATSAADHADGDGNGWWKDSVTVAVTDNGDPALADTSAGSGVDAGSFPATIVRSASGVHALSQTVRDRAGNESAAGELTVRVDATSPSVALSGCPTGPVAIESAREVGVAASDDHSGLASDPSGTFALDTTTIGPKSVSYEATDNVGHSESATCAYTVVYAFVGFFRPIEMMPTLNSVRAGSAVPVKFSLDGAPVPGGDSGQGTDVMATGYPRSQEIACDSTAPVDGVEETVTAGASSLAYDPAADQYVYVWKTDKAWAGKCRQLVLKLADGSTQRASFKLTK